MELIALIKAHRDRAAAVALVLLGFLVLLIGWLGVSDADLAVKQIPYIMSGGIAGILFVAVGAVLWVSADLRDEWRELRKLRVHVGGLEQLLSEHDFSDAELVEPAPRVRPARTATRS